MAGMTALRAGGFVRPNHLALGIGDGENIFTVGGSYEYQALGLGGKGKSQNGNSSKNIFHVFHWNGIEKKLEAKVTFVECGPKDCRWSEWTRPNRPAVSLDRTEQDKSLPPSSDPWAAWESLWCRSHSTWATEWEAGGRIDRDATRMSSKASLRAIKLPWLAFNYYKTHFVLGPHLQLPDLTGLSVDFLHHG